MEDKSVWANVDTKGRARMGTRCGDPTSISFTKKTKTTSFNTHDDAEVHENIITWKFLLMKQKLIFSLNVLNLLQISMKFESKLLMKRKYIVKY